MGAIIVILLLILVVHFTGPLVLYLAAGAVALCILVVAWLALMVSIAWVMDRLSKLFPASK